MSTTLTTPHADRRFITRLVSFDMDLTHNCESLDVAVEATVKIAMVVNYHEVNEILLISHHGRIEFDSLSEANQELVRDRIAKEAGMNDDARHEVEESERWDMYN